MKKLLIFSLLALAPIAFATRAFAIDPPDEPKPLDTMVALCGPFEIWNHVDAKQSADGGWERKVMRAWANAGGTEFELRERSNFVLRDSTNRVGCRVTSEVTQTLNGAGDLLSVVNTCGHFVHSQVEAGFLPETIFYIFDRQGRIVKEGLCKRPPRK